MIIRARLADHQRLTPRTYSRLYFVRKDRGCHQSHQISKISRLYQYRYRPITMAASAGETSLGPFSHLSVLPTNPSNPLLGLASNTIRETFGPTVQLTADALQSYGDPCTFRQLVDRIQRRTRSPPKKLGVHVGSRPSDTVSIRAALLVLIQHSIVRANIKGTQKKPIYRYSYIPERACWILRYSKYIEFSKKVLDNTAAVVVETLLLSGRQRTIDLILEVCRRDSSVNADNRKDQEKVVACLAELVGGGFIEKVPILRFENDEETEYEGPPSKKLKIEESDVDDQPSVLAILFSKARYRSDLPADTVWRVNLDCMHDQMRAHCVGRLVSEIAGHKVPLGGSLVTAALKYLSYVRHSTAVGEKLDIEASSLSLFDPRDTIKYLPKQIAQEMEKKAGGIKRSVSLAWEELVKIQDPVITYKSDGMYSISTSSLVGFIRERTMHKLILDRHDQVSARIVTILKRQGWLESELLSTFAMLPSKDTREKLHELYRNGYVELFQLSNSRQHNAAGTTYLWSVDRHRVERKVLENVAQALWNIRLRRQHEVQVNNGFLIQDRGDADENENEEDKLKEQKFWLGLERLDCALLQLDETMMILRDF